MPVKARGIGKGPAFTPGEGRADHLRFLTLDFERAEALLRHSGPELTVRDRLPQDLSGTKHVPLATVLALDGTVAKEQGPRRKR